MNAKHSKNVWNYGTSVQAHAQWRKARVCMDVSEQTAHSEAI
jgi:hypothetical protein